MTYAAQLIEAVKSACDYGSYKALAEALDVHEATLSNWRHNKGSPMPAERVMELCEMAKIADPGPWLVGVQADAVRITSVRRALESVLDRASPSVARLATLGAVLLAGYALLPAHEAITTAMLMPAWSVHYAKFAILVTLALLVLMRHTWSRGDDETSVLA